MSTIDSHGAVRSRLLVVALLASALLSACHASKEYEATVEVTRFSIVRKD